MVPFSTRINYNSDGAAICEGIYVDDVQITDASIRTCDNLDCSASAPDVVVEACSVVDLCAGTTAGWACAARWRGMQKIYHCSSGWG